MNSSAQSQGHLQPQGAHLRLSARMWITYPHPEYFLLQVDRSQIQGA